MDVVVLSVCEYSKIFMFCIGFCELCKMKMMLEWEKNKIVNGVVVNS